MNRRNIWAVTGFVIMIMAILILGPMDKFNHGYFCQETDYMQIPVEKWGEQIHLENGDFDMKFSPTKSHFAGFEINLWNQPEDNTGILRLTVMDEDGDQIDSMTADLSKVKEGIWYKLYNHAELKKGEIYTLRFSVSECSTVPYLQTIDSEYLPKENISGDILLGYAYKESTFTFQEKVLISFFIIAAWGIGCSYFFDGKTKKIIKIMAAGLFMVTVLSWNYMYNSMDVYNGSFEEFQMDSEGLVTTMVNAERNGDFLNNEGFGLGCRQGMSGIYWMECQEGPYSAVVMDSNAYTQSVAVVGNYMQFNNGEVSKIVKIESSDEEIIAYIDFNKEEREGKSLENVIFCDASREPLATSVIVAYTSQFGLQGKVFRWIAKLVPNHNVIKTLNLMCCIAAAAVFVMIVMLIQVKYNSLMAGCFFSVFWLSPWIVDFARNLYWVEFTWFLPMAIGIFCAWKINNYKYRILSYIAAFLSITVKCLCGYEYISSIMMGLIVFMVVDFVMAILKRNRDQAVLLFRTICIVGIVALMGFMTAICIHAVLRGNGNIPEGIMNIFQQVVLKRTNGADLNEFDARYWESFNASIWETYRRYFHFNSEIITGITGNLFPLLCIIPLCIFGYEYKSRKLNMELVVLYVFFFLTAVSWFCMAKSHSYIHTHMNYVLWYFGFVQICLYIPLNKVTELYRNIVPVKSEEKKD